VPAHTGTDPGRRLQRQKKQGRPGFCAPGRATRRARPDAGRRRRFPAGSGGRRGCRPGRALADDDLDAPPPPSVYDPLQGWNRFWFTFNDYFYAGLRPLVIGYKTVVPEFARTGLKNVYDNFTFPIRFLNALLQLDMTKAAREFGRFLINSTFGVGGLVDLAKSDPNLQPGDEDFGQTLGYYGMGEGFYIVWPLLGPSTARDSVGMVGDIAANPLTWLFGLWNFYGEDNYWYLSYVISGGNRFNRLPEYPDNYEAMKKSAIEPYVSMRDFYIQYRQGRIEQ
jgi:phospholipid-binding lipoprotein MlaA